MQYEVQRAIAAETSLSGENCVLALTAGAIESLVAVMRAHVGGDADVMEQACWTMFWICDDNGVWARSMSCYTCFAACGIESHSQL